MSIRLIEDEHLLLMKVGFHGREALDAILERKLIEQKMCGHCYWGYGGTLCHPVKAVRPFAAQAIKTKRRVLVAFVVTQSPFQAENPKPATECSLDGESWFAVEQGAAVYASRAALVLSSLQQAETSLDLSCYHVGIGPSTGKPAAEYFRYRVDKALLTRSEPSTEHKFVPIAFLAELVEPYAILVR